MLKTRFGNALQTTIDVPAQWLNHRIPPLTLQLLVENAVKHNIVSAAQPWRPNITVEKDRLCVFNNLQPKVLNLPSEKVGLANIMARYRLLRQPFVPGSRTGYCEHTAFFKRQTYPHHRTGGGKQGCCGKQGKSDGI